MPRPPKSSATSRAATPAAAAPPARKESVIRIELPDGPYPVLFFANKIGLDTISEEPLVHFATLSGSGSMLAQFAAIFENEMIRTNKTDWGRFLAQNGLAENPDADFSFRCSSSSLKAVPLASFIVWALGKDHGEIRLYSLSMGEAAIARREGKPSCNGQPIALVRMPSELFRQLLANILLQCNENA